MPACRKPEVIDDGVSQCGLLMKRSTELLITESYHLLLYIIISTSEESGK